MARPRTFDRDEVLDRAVQLFWTQGYERTSVQDLVDSMGIQRGSLYAAFGDKKHLFLEALDRYEQTFRGEMERLLDGPGRAHDGIRAVFERVLHECSCDDGYKGCFMTNTAVALSEKDEDTIRRIHVNLKHMEDVFCEALQRDATAGTLGEHQPRRLARFLTNSLQGLRVLSRCRADSDVLKDTIEVTLSLLEPTSRSRNPQLLKGVPSHG